MRETVYIDVLLCLNLFINYFILLGCAKFLGVGVIRARLLAASIIGALFSLYILLPTLNIFFSLCVEVLMASIIILVGFGFGSKVKFIKSAVCFFSMNFSFAGCMFLLWNFFTPKGLIMNNGIVYFNISPIVLIVSTVVAYIIIRLFNTLTGRAKTKGELYKLVIYKDGLSCNLIAKLDTANSLIEPFSGLPVIVVEYTAIKKLFSEQEQKLFITKGAAIKEKVVAGKEQLNSSTEADLGLKLKLRFIPFNTISGNGLLPAFKAEKIEIKSIIAKDLNIVEAYIAVCSNDKLYEGTQALLNPDLLKML